MRFAHLADCHLGAWNAHPDLRELPIVAFNRALDICFREGVDFILIAGDLFDTSIPSIDILKSAVSKLKECRDMNIPVYVIPGSHDYSPSGKTMLSVLEEADLLKDVSLKFVTDKSGAKIFGVPGKRGGLDKFIYDELDKEQLEREDGFKIFLFHAAISELFPIKQMISVPLDLLPKKFDYYASGHIHEIFHKKVDERLIAYPGSLFSTDFTELEKYMGRSGFYIVAVDGGEINIEWKEVDVCEVEIIDVDCTNKTPRRVEEEHYREIEKKELFGKILLMKIYGTLDGRQSDIDFKSILTRAYEKGTKSVKKNVHIETKEMEDIKSAAMISDIEKELIEKNIDKITLSNFPKEQRINLVRDMMDVLKEEKIEGETTYDFEDRIKEYAKMILNFR